MNLYKNFSIKKVKHVVSLFIFTLFLLGLGIEIGTAILIVPAIGTALVLFMIILFNSVEDEWEDSE